MRFIKDFLIKALLVSAMMVSASYMVVRSMYFLTAGYKAIDKAFALSLLIAEAFIVMHGLGYALSVLTVFRNKRNKKVEARFKIPESSRAGDDPSVAVLIPARHEPQQVLENTFITVNNMDYKNKKVYFLDDSVDEKYKKEAKELCNKYNLTLFRRTKPWHGAKAGIINDCLERLKEDYVVIFDADQNPLPNFLKTSMPLFKNDNRLAFVQLPQFYSNIENSFVARAASFQQAVFHEYICEGKSLSDAMFCCGTNVIFRIEALREIGGFDEKTVTEDFATSIKIHAKGWRSLYSPHVYTFGMGPENLDAYFQQQFRWAAGTITVFKNTLKQLLTRPFSLRFRQWVEYFLSSTYYFIGTTFYIMMICPITYLLFKVPSFFARYETCLLYFIPYFILSVGTFYLLLRQRNYRIKDLFFGQLLGITAFSVYMRAAFTALLGAKLSFGVTSKERGKAIPYIRLWPQVGMILLNFAAVAWGVNRYIYEMTPAVLINVIWAAYHMCILSSIFYFNREV